MKKENKRVKAGHAPANGRLQLKREGKDPIGKDTVYQAYAGRNRKGW